MSLAPSLEGDLRHRVAGLLRAEELSELPFLEWEPASGHASWSSGFLRLLGVKREHLDGRLDAFLPFVGREDRQSLQEALGAVARGAEPMELRVRMVGYDGLRRSVVVRAAGFDDGGRRRVFAALRDVTEEERGREALRSSGERLALAVRAAEAGSWEWHVASGRLEWSDEVYELLGLDRANVQPSFDAWLARVHPEDRERVAAAIDAARWKGREFDLDYRILRPDGEVRWLREVARTAKDPHDRTVGLFGVQMDVTARRRAEEDRQRSEQRFQGLFEHAADGIFLADAAARFVEVNRAASELLGYRRDELIGKHVTDILAPEEAAGAPVRLQEVRAGATVIAERSLVHRSGERVPTEIKARALPDGSLLAIVRDVRERRRQEEERNRLLAEVRALGVRLAQTEEEERRRLARELHDRVGQNLAVLSMTLGILRRELVDRSPDLAPRIEDALSLVRETGALIRDVMADLRPPVLDDHGLLAALEWLAGRLRARTGLDARVHGRERGPRPSSSLETALFRIAQEALTNVLRHAEARHVDVRLVRTPKRLRLVVLDDGRGFDPRRHAGSRESWGLISMRERAEALGGRLTLGSRDGAGTRLCVEVPR